MQQPLHVQQNKIQKNQLSHHSQQQFQQNPQLQESNQNQQKQISKKQQFYEQKHWEAHLIDGKFYLTDPQSLQKLKKIQQQIQQQKKKLQMLEIQGVDTIQQSFYSLQQEEDKHLSEKSQAAITDMNQSLLINNKKKAEKDLHEQQQNYRSKIMKMQRKRPQIKKQIMPSAEENQNQPVHSELTLNNQEQDKLQSAEQLSLSKKSRPVKQYQKSADHSQKNQSKHSAKLEQMSQKDGEARSQRKSKASESDQKMIKQNSLRSQSKKSKKSSVKKESQHQPSNKESANIAEHNDISKEISHKLNLQQRKSSKKSQSAHHSSNLSEARKKYNIAIHQYKDNSNSQLQTQNEQLQRLSKMMTKKAQIVVEHAQSNQKQEVSKKSEHQNSEVQHSQKNPISQRKSRRSQKKVDQEIKSNRSQQISHNYRQQQQKQKSMKQQQIYSRKSNIKSQNKMLDNNNSHLQDNYNASQRNSKGCKQASVSKQAQIKQQKSIKSSRKADHSSNSKNKQHSIKKSVQQSLHKQNTNQDQSYLKDNKSQQVQDQKQLLEVKSNRNKVKTSKVNSQANYQEASQKAESIIQPSQKSGLKSAKMSIQKQSHQQQTVKSNSKFSQKGQKSMEYNIIIQNQEKIQSKIQIGQERQSKMHDKSQKSKTISKKSSRNSKQSSVMHQKQEQQKRDKNSCSVKNYESIESSRNPNLVQKHSEQSVISSIKPNHLEKQSKKDVFYDHKSVQCLQRPEDVASQQANFGKNKKVYQASQKSHNKSNRVTGQKEQAIQEQASHKKSVQIQREKSIKETSNVEAKSPKKSNLDADFLKKTKKQDIKCNQSEIHQGQCPKEEKRNKSFIIHYRKPESVVGSHKSSQKRKSSAQKSSNLAYESKPKQQIFLKLQQEQDSKAQIQALNKQVRMLQSQLKKVEQRQVKIEEIYKEQKQQKKQQKQQERFNFNQSDSAVKIQSASSEQAMSPLLSNKIRSLNGIQNRLNIASLITHFNSVEESQNKKAQDYEKNEKQRLKEEISNLKKIIRDMQMDKIKSIDHDTINSGKNQQRAETFINHKADNSQIFDRWKQSLNSNEIGVTQQLQWNSDILKTNNKFSQLAGKIVKISPRRSNIEMSPHQKHFKVRQYGSLRRKQSQISQPALFGGNSLDNDFKDLTVNKFQSSNPSPRRKVNPQLVRQQILERLQANQKNFQKFIVCSKIIKDGEQNSEYLSAISKKSQNALQYDQQQQMEQIKMSQLRHQSFRQDPSMIDKKNKLQTLLNKFNSHEAQKIEQIALSDELITFSNWELPKLPDTPNQLMKQEDLLEKAKQTFKIFGIKTQNNEQDLCIKKYKNCVMFTFAPCSDVILWHFSGKFYIGGWKINDLEQGQKSGEGIQYVPEKYVFKGQFLNGNKNGSGFIKTPNGNIYEGQFVDGVKNGRGKYFQASTNSTYNGQWRQGKKDGFGVLKLSQKQYYQGTFVNSIKHGYGTQKFINGDYYKGQYSNGRFCGKGKYVWSNSSSFQGDFVDGCRHGQGTWRSCSKNGDVYIGEYLNDKKCGYGRYIWENGCTFEGYFKNDVKHGKGRLSYPDGKQIKGVWQNGILASTDQNRRQFEQQDEPLRKSLKFSMMNKSKISRLNGN